MPSLSQTTARCIAALPGGVRMLRHAAGGGDASQAPVFMLHRVLPDIRDCYDPEMAVSVAVLAQFLDWLAAHYTVVPLLEVAARRGRGGARPVCALTFDDGWAD